MTQETTTLPATTPLALAAGDVKDWGYFFTVAPAQLQAAIEQITGRTLTYIWLHVESSGAAKDGGLEDACDGHNNDLELGKHCDAADYREAIPNVEDVDAELHARGMFEDGFASKHRGIIASQLHRAGSW
jgi:hypothetical protein